MDTGSFKAWLSVLAGLSDAQIEEAGVALIAAREARPGVEVSCGPAALAAEGELLARIGQARQARQGCPHCGGDEIGRWGRCRGKPRYRCASCSRTFTPLTGTPLAGLHYPDRWGLQADALMAGEARHADRHHRDQRAAHRQPPDDERRRAEAQGDALQHAHRAQRLHALERQRAVGGRSEAKLYPGLNHADLVASFSPLFRAKAPVLKDVTGFLRRALDRDDETLA